MAVDDSCSNGTDEKADIADIGTADAVVSLGPNCLPAYHIAKATSCFSPGHVSVTVCVGP
jgi:hypothetical protein